jgi:hypothetical protein
MDQTRSLETKVFILSKNDKLCEMQECRSQGTKLWEHQNINCNGHN